MVVTAIVAASLIHIASAHGSLLLPPARQEGLSSLDEAGTVCRENSCGWYEYPTAIPGSPTNCDVAFGTVGNPNPCKLISTRPWRAPGTAPLKSSCGFHGGSAGGDDGTLLPPMERTIWKTGSIVEVAHAIRNNHGGGYAYRLCPASETPNEACFQAHHLAFVDDTISVHFVNGSKLSIPAVTFTTPDGNQWRKGPIPKNPSKDHNFPAPFPLASSVNGPLPGDRWAFSLFDRVKLPFLPAGDYLLSWRWDVEAKQEVWTNCGDVTLVDGPVPPPTPVPPAPLPVPSPPAPAPLPPKPPAHPTCCWSNWGDSNTCAGYPGGGAKCNTDWNTSCNGNSDCNNVAII